MRGDRDEVEGLTVRMRDGQVLGVVVGVFTDGALAGRPWVEGDDDLGGDLADQWVVRWTAGRDRR
jgi:hypothetical protein